MEKGRRPAAADAMRERLLDALYDSMAELPMWQGFLRAAREAFACDHVSLSFDSWRVDRDEPVLFASEDLAPRSAELLHRVDLFEALATETAVEIAAPAQAGVDVARALAISIAAGPERTACLALWRSPARGPFDAAAHALLDSLVGPLKRAVKLFFRIADLERRRIVFNAVLETSDIGVVLADAEANVLFTNSIADALLEAGDGLRLAYGKLRARTPAESANLIEHVRRKAAEQQAEPDFRVYAPIALSRADNPLPLTVIVRPGPAFHPLRSPLRRTAMLVLRDPGARPIIPAATLTRLFGLTSAESLLASELARGASLDEAASHLGIRRNTARTHLQAIFMKTGTNRQGELVRVLFNSAAALSR